METKQKQQRNSEIEKVTLPRKHLEYLKEKIQLLEKENEKFRKWNLAKENKIAKQEQLIAAFARLIANYYED